MNKTISQQLAEKTLRELERAEKPNAQSRSWKDPIGYRFLTPWSNAVLLRILVRTLTVTYPKSEYRRKSQMDDATHNTKDYLNFLGYSQGSLEEVKGMVKDVKGEDLTYEIFIELINKTDWLLRQLVQSLERKLGDYKLELGGMRKSL